MLTRHDVMFGKLANGRPAPRTVGVWNIIAAANIENEWNEPNQIEERLINARRSAAEIAAWRKMVKVR